MCASLCSFYNFIEREAREAGEVWIYARACVLRRDVN